MRYEYHGESEKQELTRNNTGGDIDDHVFFFCIECVSVCLMCSVTLWSVFVCYSKCNVHVFELFHVSCLCSSIIVSVPVSVKFVVCLLFHV